MIVNSSLKSMIVSYYNEKSSYFSNDYEKCATEVILYKYLLSISQSTITYDFVRSSGENYLTVFTSLKGNYTAYLSMTTYLQDLDCDSLLKLKEDDIDTLYDFYCNSKEIIKFSIDTFDERMYNTYNLSTNELEYLEHIHYDVMCPIIKFYNKVYGIPIANMNIVSSDTSSVPGKKIVFYINGISITNIYRNIINKRINIKYYNIDIKAPNIEIINY